jgi:hypothetical protein
LCDVRTRRVASRRDDSLGGCTPTCALAADALARDESNEKSGAFFLRHRRVIVAATSRSFFATD